LTERNGFDEIASPLETRLNTRWQRGVVSVGRAYQRFCPDCFRDREDRRVYAGLDGEAQIYRLNFTDFELTLGWQLSDVSQGLIAAHSGSPERCLAARSSLRLIWPWSARVLNENNCSSCKIMYTLTGRLNELQSIAPSVTQSPVRAKGPLPTWVALCRADAAASNTVPAFSTPETTP